MKNGSKITIVDKCKYLLTQNTNNGDELVPNAPHYSYTDDVTNEEARKRIKHTLGPYKDFLAPVKWRKLKWYDHASKSSGLIKTIRQGTVNGGIKRCGQRKR